MDEGIPFVGRVIARASLRSLLARLAQGRGAIAMVEGEPGIGKSRLVREVLVDHGASGWQVLRGTSEQLARIRPFGVVAGALELTASSPDPERRRLGKLLCSDVPDRTLQAPGVGPSPALREEVVEGVVSLLERMATRRPLVLVLEDLQWADECTLLVLRRLGQRLSQVPLAVVVTFRPTPRSVQLDVTIADLVAVGGTHLELSDLEDKAVTSLVTSLVGAPPGPRLLDGVRRARGNPLFIVELLRALVDEGLIVVDPHQAEATTAAFPRSLRLTLLRRLSFLCESTLELLRVASVLGSRIRIDHLGLVTRRPATELLPNLEEAVRAGVLQDDGVCLTFHHDLIREALYYDLSAALRAALHLDAAWALADAGAPAVTVAEHLVAGASPGDLRAVRWLHRAAQDAAARAPGVARELLERAIEVADPMHPHRDALMADLISARYWSGQVKEAEMLARAVLSRPHDPSVEGTLRIGLVEALLGQLRFPEAVVEATAALALPDLDDRARLRLEAEGCWGRLFSGDLESALAATRTAREKAQTAGDLIATCVSLNVGCHAALMAGRVADAVAAGAESSRLSQGSHELRRFFPGPVLASALIEADRLNEAEEVLRRAREMQEMGLAFQTITQWAFVWLRFVAGDWDDVQPEAEVAIALTEEAGAQRAVFVQAAMALIALHRDDLAGAGRAMLDAEKTLAVAGPQYRAHWLLWAKAMLDEATGNREGALAALGEAWRLCVMAGTAGEFPVLGPDLVRLTLASGDPERAVAVASQVREAATGIGAPWAEGAACRCRGLVEDDPDVLLNAVKVLQTSPRPLLLAVANEEAGHALEMHGRSAEAVAAFQEALRIYDGLGALRDIRRVEASLRHLGIRRGGRGPRHRPDRGWESLTRAEMDVVRLVVEGLSNREVAERLFVSPRTVETHLAHVFTKLGISSRRELRSQAVRRVLGGN